MQYVAAPLAGTLGAPLLGIPSSGPSAADISLLQGLGVEEVLVVGPVAGTGTFSAHSMTIDTVSASSDLATVSQAVAARIEQVNDINRTVTVEAAPGLFAVGSLCGVALAFSAIYQGACCASAISASKSKPEIFGLSAAPAAIVEGFAVFAFIFALVVAGGIPSTTS